MSDFKDRLKADQERIRRQIKKDAAAAEKKIKPAEDKLATTEIVYSTQCEKVLNLIDDFQKTELKFLEKEKEEFLKHRVTIEDYKARKVTADEYREKGVTRDGILKAMRSKSDESLGELIDAIRSEQMTVFEIQLDLEKQKQNLVFLMSQPVSLEIAYLKSKIIELESENSGLMHDSPGQNSRIRKLKTRINQTKAGVIVEGRAWYNVTPGMIGNTLRFDPTIPKHLIPELMSIRQEMIDLGITALNSPLTLTPQSTRRTGEGEDVVKLDRSGWTYFLQQGVENEPQSETNRT